MDRFPLSARRARAVARKSLIVPVLAAGLTVAALPADADTPQSPGLNSAGGVPPVVTPADPAAWGRPAGIQTGRRPR